MRVGVDGRSLAGDGRGVAVYASGMLAALEAAGVELRVHTPRNRLVHGAAAVVGRPRLERLLAPVDVVWLPAPAPVAVGRGTPYVLTLHDLTLLERPADFTPYERLWHRLARPGALVRRAARVVAASMDTAKRARVRFGVDVDVVPAGPGDPGPDPDPSAVAAVRERERRAAVLRPVVDDHQLRRRGQVRAQRLQQHGQLGLGVVQHDHDAEAHAAASSSTVRSAAALFSQLRSRSAAAPPSANRRRSSWSLATASRAARSPSTSPGAT